MPNIERQVLTGAEVKKLFGDGPLMTEDQRAQTARERDVIDEAQFKTGRPLILTVK